MTSAVVFSHFQHKVRGTHAIVLLFISNIYLVFDRIPVRFSRQSKYLTAVVTRRKGLDINDLLSEKIIFKIFMYFLHSTNTMTGPNLSFFLLIFHSDWLHGRAGCSNTIYYHCRAKAHLANEQ